MYPPGAYGTRTGHKLSGITPTGLRSNVRVRRETTKCIETSMGWISAHRSASRAAQASSDAGLSKIVAEAREFALDVVDVREALQCDQSDWGALSFVSS